MYAIVHLDQALRQAEGSAYNHEASNQTIWDTAKNDERWSDGL